jgi:LmbE family N-acetylglucosaminyl deacetylase
MADDRKAIRRAAMEEAARICDGMATTLVGIQPEAEHDGRATYLRLAAKTIREVANV